LVADRSERREWWQGLRSTLSRRSPPAPRADQLLRLAEAQETGNAAYLIAALTEPALRGRATQALGALRSLEAVPALLRLLDARDPSVRVEAARTLGAIGEPSTVAPLIEVAERDEEIPVRTWAVGAVGQIAGPTAMSGLRGLLTDPSPSVRRAAAQALADHGDVRGLQAIAAIRRRERFTPRTMRAARPSAPVDVEIALTLAVTWGAATAAVAATLPGGWSWLGEAGVALVFREIWLRFGERAARRLGVYSPERGFKLRWEATLTAYLVAAVQTAVLGFVISRRAALLSVFFLALRIAKHLAERRELEA
jgi:hypothetical protein